MRQFDSRLRPKKLPLWLELMFLPPRVRDCRPARSCIDLIGRLNRMGTQIPQFGIHEASMLVD
jgi:hypothetical protein